MELPFAAEIGDATVGSLTSSISKDSGLGDMTLSGSLYKSIVGVTYLDHMGETITLKDRTNATELSFFKSSEGLLGIVVEVELVIRQAKLVTFTNKVMATDALMAGFAGGDFQVSPSTNYWIILHPEYSLLQERMLALPGTKETDAQTVALIVNATRASFAKGVISMALSSRGEQQRPIVWTTYKRNMVNHYGVRM